MAVCSRMRRTLTLVVSYCKLEEDAQAASAEEYAQEEQLEDAGRRLHPLVQLLRLRQPRRRRKQQ